MDSDVNIEYCNVKTLLTSLVGGLGLVYERNSNMAIMTFILHAIFYAGITSFKNNMDFCSYNLKLNLLNNWFGVEKTFQAEF